LARTAEDEFEFEFELGVAVVGIVEEGVSAVADAPFFL
jgi:hypothetical protein